MSDQYKLIQWYPSLPKRLEEGDIVKKGWTACGDRYIAKGKGNVPIDEVENNPEFWQKVSKKDYVILSMRGLSSGWIYTRTENGFFVVSRPFGDYYVSSEDNSCEIYSVERLFDGEIFTLGDYIHCFNEGGEIAEFELKGETMYVHFDDDRSTYQKEWCNLKNIYHPKKPLFTTKDGVDIYEGDTAYAVLKKERILVGSSENYNFDDPSLEYFSSKQAAQQYIEHHKLRYSNADIDKIIEKCHESWFHGAWRLKTNELRKYLKDGS